MRDQLRNVWIVVLDVGVQSPKQRQRAFIVRKNDVGPCVADGGVQRALRKNPVARWWVSAMPSTASIGCPRGRQMETV